MSIKCKSCKKPIRRGTNRYVKDLHNKCYIKKYGKPKQSKTTPIEYTLEQFLEEQKRANKVTETLEKMASVLEKFESFSILIDHRVTKLEKEIKKLGKK